MHTKIALVFVFVIALGLVGSASAHKSEIIGNYKIEVGWKNEPPVVGMDNHIELTVTTATAFDKAEDEKEDQAMEGMGMEDTHDSKMTDDDHAMESKHNIGEPISTGILKGFTANMILGDTDIPLNLVEDSKFPGVYRVQFTPTVTGHPMIHVIGILDGEEANMTFHPEQVESLSTLSPLKQMANGINPGDVQCKEGFDLYMRTFDYSAVCLHTSSAEKLMQRGVVTHF